MENSKQGVISNLALRGELVEKHLTQKYLKTDKIILNANQEEREVSWVPVALPANTNLNIRVGDPDWPWSGARDWHVRYTYINYCFF